ncbi:MAG: GTPase HflX [bacterium]|nr:GTPase HflX [bacterium]
MADLSGDRRTWQEEGEAFFEGGKQRVFLVGIEKAGSAWPAADSLEELAELCRTLGAEVAGSAVARRAAAGQMVGEGKLREFGQEAGELGAPIIVFDTELTGSQQRKLEAATGRQVLDRTQVILDIFAHRARTREGKLQVELARLSYLLPRLAGRWPELSRLGGGIGTRGPGEAKLEVERRRLRRRLGELRREIDQVRRHRELLRAGRRAVPFPLLVLIGYTNAGKSTLFNGLTAAAVAVEDRLFATLDPTTRAVVLPNRQRVLLTDTVGFIQRLPTQLVAAFRATLEEVREGDLLLHVIDASHPRWLEQAATVKEILAELGAADRPVLRVLNKTDRVPLDEHHLAALETDRQAVAVSALTGRGLDRLLEQVAVELAATRCRLAVSIPYHQGDLLTLVHDKGQVLREDYGEESVAVEVEIESVWAERVKRRLREVPG